VRVAFSEKIPEIFLIFRSRSYKQEFPGARCVFRKNFRKTFLIFRSRSYKQKFPGARCVFHEKIYICFFMPPDMMYCVFVYNYIKGRGRSGIEHIIQNLTLIFYTPLRLRTYLLYNMKILLSSIKSMFQAFAPTNYFDQPRRSLYNIAKFRHCNLGN